MRDATNKYRPPRVSVIVPCKNEESHILHTLEQVSHHEPHEIIIVDGGSSDRTVELLHSTSIKHQLFTSYLSNRGAQMNLAAQHATGEVLLFLHSDTQLPALAIEQIQAHFKKGFHLGCFNRHFHPNSPLLAITSRLAYWRSKFFFWSYGDQALFISREKFEQLGGYEEWSMLEDLDLALRAKKLCQFNVIDTPIQTSARRFADAPLKVLLSDFWLSMKFICGLYRPHQD